MHCEKPRKRRSRTRRDRLLDACTDGLADGLRTRIPGAVGIVLNTMAVCSSLLFAHIVLGVPATVSGMGAGAGSVLRGAHLVSAPPINDGASLGMTWFRWFGWQPAGSAYVRNVYDPAENSSSRSKCPGFKFAATTTLTPADRGLGRRSHPSGPTPRVSTAF